MIGLLSTASFLAALVTGHAAFTSLGSRIPTSRKMWVVPTFITITGVLLAIAVALG